MRDGERILAFEQQLIVGASWVDRPTRFERVEKGAVTGHTRRATPVLPRHAGYGALGPCEWTEGRPPRLDDAVLLDEGSNREPLRRHGNDHGHRVERAVANDGD